MSTGSGVPQHAIRGVVFDKDGTLFDFNAVWSVWCERVIDELANGNMVTAKVLADTIGYNKDSRSFTSGSLIVSGAANESADAMARVLAEKDTWRINEICIRHTRDLPLAPVDNLSGVLEVLHARGLKLGVATNDSEDAAHEQLRRTNIEQYFDFVSGFDSGFGSKPGPGMLQAFCQSSGLAASAIAMVGDSLHDINAGIAAGVGLTVGVLTGPASECELAAKADIVLPDIGRLAGVLASE